MKKIIDIPDDLIPSLKRVAKEDYRSPKTWIEHLIITTLSKPGSKKFERTKGK